MVTRNGDKMVYAKIKLDDENMVYMRFHTL
jgi:hypothetical protein